jgi:hypothetical protein
MSVEKAKGLLGFVGDWASILALPIIAWVWWSINTNQNLALLRSETTAKELYQTKADAVLQAAAQRNWMESIQTKQNTMSDTMNQYHYETLQAIDALKSTPNK